MQVIASTDNQVILHATKEELAQQTAAFSQKGLEGADNSQLAYASDMEHVEAWLMQHGLVPLPMNPATPGYVPLRPGYAPQVGDHQPMPSHHPQVAPTASSTAPA